MWRPSTPTPARDSVIRQDRRKRDRYIPASTCKFDDSQLHDEVINKFLNLLFRKVPRARSRSDINIKEGGGAAK